MNLRTKKIDLQNGLKKLRTWLQHALEIEHATIPPYFAAWLSIMDGYNAEPRDIIKSVFTEEMLHLTLVANLMNAVEGKPDLTHKHFVPRYPHKLPYSDGSFKISIEKFSINALEIFRKIERPEKKHAVAEGNNFATIGQFYAAVKALIDELCKEHGEQKVFTGNIELQIQPGDYYGSGELIVVHNKKTAHHAIRIIADQGEGSHHTIFDDDDNIFGEEPGKELAHYYRFNEIFAGRHYLLTNTHKSGPTGPRLNVNYEKVYPIIKNIDRRDFPKESEEWRALDAFAKSYEALLGILNKAFNGHRSKMNEAFARMFALRNQAVALMRTPVGDGTQTLGLDFSP